MYRAQFFSRYSTSYSLPKPLASIQFNENDVDICKQKSIDFWFIHKKDEFSEYNTIVCILTNMENDAESYRCQLIHMKNPVRIVKWNKIKHETPVKYKDLF